MGRFLQLFVQFLLCSVSLFPTRTDFPPDAFGWDLVLIDFTLKNFNVIDSPAVQLKLSHLPQFPSCCRILITGFSIQAKSEKWTFFRLFCSTCSKFIKVPPACGWGLLKFPINISWKVNFTHGESSSHILWWSRSWLESGSWRLRRQLILRRAFCVANDKRSLFVGFFCLCVCRVRCCCCLSQLCLMGLQGSRGLQQLHPSACWRGRRWEFLRGTAENHPTVRLLVWNID